MIDVSLFYFFQDVLRTAFIAPQDLAKNLSARLSLVFLLIAILSFFIQALYFLAMRRQRNIWNPLYYKKGLLHYAQLMIYYSLFLLLSLIILVNFGIVKYPSVPGVLVMFLQMVGSLIVFYCLDSRSLFIDLFLCVERAFNLFVYNLPFFLLVLVFFAGLQLFVVYCFSSVFGVTSSWQTLICKESVSFITDVLRKQPHL